MDIKGLTNVEASTTADNVARFAQSVGEMKCKRRISKFGKIVVGLIQVSVRQRTFGLRKSMRSKRVEE